jgi:hypothetical protein
MRKYGQITRAVVFNRVAVNGLQPWVQRSRFSGEVEPTDRRPPLPRTALAVTGMSQGGIIFRLWTADDKAKRSCGSHHVLERNQVFLSRHQMCCC